MTWKSMMKTISPALLALCVLGGCDSSDPVALEGDEIDIFAFFLTADQTTGEFEAILQALVRDPTSGVRRDGVEVLWRVTTGSAILSDTQVLTNDDGEAFIRVQAVESITIEATSGTATETINLDATGGEVGENDPPTAAMSFTPASPRQGQAVTFDVSDSEDTDGIIDTWKIEDFGDGDSSNTFQFEDTTTTSHTYSTDGTYEARLRVTDNGGQTDTVTVTVSVSP